MMNKAHVLVVDDNPEIRGLIVATLGTNFYELGQAATGQQALDYLATHDLPHLVILDLAMPGMSGLDVLDMLKNDPEMHQIEVIVLSANADQITTDNALGQGARAVLTKPFSPLELLQTVESILG
ncbi:MAG: PleD family two-component system response regulator [Anaerolineales bacterium]